MATFERLKEAYSYYCFREFGEERTLTEDVREVPVMYTTSEDEERDYQVTYFVDDLQLKYFIDEECVWVEQFDSLDELADCMEGSDFEGYYYECVSHDEEAEDD